MLLRCDAACSASSAPKAEAFEAGEYPMARVMEMRWARSRCGRLSALPAVCAIC
jgi:hypothetical protein